ncbi:MAG: hypothetical protein IJP86_01985 [Synergistaceae bacterium]|nr:hypothetical protein [Synergistaceae bacterium]
MTLTEITKTYTAPNGETKKGKSSPEIFGFTSSKGAKKENDSNTPPEQA